MADQTIILLPDRRARIPGTKRDAPCAAPASNQDLTYAVDVARSVALDKQEVPPVVGQQPAPGYPAGLTSREVEVLRLVADGLTDAEVAAKLYISPRTVQRHLSTIFGRLNVSSRTAAARFAVEHSLVRHVAHIA
jgi:DNA-binding NarL/FixJ family response regulator